MSKAIRNRYSLLAPPGTVTDRLRAFPRNTVHTENWPGTVEKINRKAPNNLPEGPPQKTKFADKPGSLWNISCESKEIVNPHLSSSGAFSKHVVVSHMLVFSMFKSSGRF